MRLYYIAEAEGRRRHVWSALGVDAERWNGVVRGARDWRLALHDRYGIAPAVALQPLDMLDAGVPPSREGKGTNCLSHEEVGEILRGGLRLIEGEGRRGGVEVINVCLPPARRRRDLAEVALGRLLTRVNTSAGATGRHAFVIFAEEQEAQVARLYRRLRVHNPIPSRFESWEDGAPTRNIPIDAIIGGPAFRRPANDHLLQLAGFVACALLLQEDRGAAGEGGNGQLRHAFSILACALNSEASRLDRQGVVRR